MTSNINYNNIDGTYPVAGVDNDSQGFRTNFTNIKTNFQSAKAEIEDLQNNVILKSSLTGTTLNNDMGGNGLSDATIFNFSETIVDLSSTSGTIVLNHAAAHNYSVTPNGAITLAFTSLPLSGQLGRFRLKIVLDSGYATKTVTLPSSVSKGLDSIEGRVGQVITYNAAGTYYLEFTSDDNGQTFHVNDLTRPRMNTAASADWSNTSYPNFSRYNYISTTTGSTIAANNTTFIDSTTTLSTLSVNLPTLASDGQIVTINTNNAITTLTISATNLVLGNVTTLASNSSIKFQFVGVSTPQKWFKL